MKKELRDAWVKALRSGEYNQAKQYLQVGDKFCCLGVLCKVAQKRRFKIFFDVDGELKGASLHFQPRLEKIVGDEAQAISNMNDTGKSFAQIADYIEKNIPVT